MSRVTGRVKKHTTRAPAHRGVTWPSRSDAGDAGRILRDGTIRKKTLATISNTSRTLDRALKRLADK